MTVSPQDIIETFRAFMRANDVCISGDINPDGKLHRAHDDSDKPGVKDAWYKLVIDARPAGAFGHNRKFGNDHKITWTSGEHETPLTALEIAEFNKLRADKKLAAAAEMEARHAKAAERAQRGLDNSEECPADHPYLVRKGVKPVPGLRQSSWEAYRKSTKQFEVVCQNAILVPMRDTSGKLHGLQGIFPEKLKDFDNLDKTYLPGCEKHSHFFLIGERTDVTVICEGLATGISIHDCTGLRVLVAFDSSNLTSVAQAMRKARKDAKILMAADNDRWTISPVNNPGVTRAAQAAAMVGAGVAIPVFKSEDGRPTDFNDLHQREGVDAVKSIIDAAIANMDAPAIEKKIIDMPLPPADEDEGDDGPSNNSFFAILGYDHENYFFFSHGKRQVVTYTKSDFNDGGFLGLADLSFWENNFMSPTAGINKKSAANFLIRFAEKRGIYDIGRIRGRGAWMDAGRQIYHHGNYLTVDGVRTEVTKIKSKYVYELAKALKEPADTGMTDAEGMNLLELVSRFKWANKGSSALLVGWIALAPLCGALRWRPHIWVAGNAGSGKSTLLEHIVSPLLRGMNLFAQGNSTEPGIRQELKADAIPVLWDEAEQNEDGDIRRVQAMLSLVRQASTESEAKTFKGTISGKSMHFHIRSMFCLASIQVGIKHQADIERLSVLTLNPAEKTSEASAQWLTLKNDIHCLIARDANISARLFRRSLDMLPTILKNIEVFTTVAARLFKNQRAGDQYGTMLAGTYAMIRQTPATEKDAEDLIRMYTWTEQLEGGGDDEGQRALQSLMESHIRLKGSEISVYEVVCAAANKGISGSIDISPTDASTILNRYGMRLDGQYLMLSNGSNELRNLMANSTFSADWRGVLLRLPGSDRNDNKAVRINGVLTRVTRISLAGVLGDDAPAPLPLQSEIDTSEAPDWVK